METEALSLPRPREAGLTHSRRWSPGGPLAVGSVGSWARGDGRRRGGHGRPLGLGAGWPRSAPPCVRGTGRIGGVASPQNRRLEADWVKTRTRPWGHYAEAARATGKDGGQSSFSSLGVLSLLFEAKSRGNHPACVCNCFVLLVCGAYAHVLRCMSLSTACAACNVCTVFARVCEAQGLRRRQDVCRAGGQAGTSCGWWRWAACGRRWGGGAGSRHWMWGLGGGGLGQPAPDRSLVQLSCSAPGAPRGQWPSHTHGSTGSHLSVREPEHPGLRAPPARGAARESPHVRPLTALAPPPAACGSGQGVSLSVKGVSSPLAAWGPGRSSQGPRHRWCCSGGSPGIPSNRPGCPTPHLARPG